MLINVVGGADMRMREIQEAASLIQEQAHEDANIIFGASIDQDMGDVLKVTVIATGFDKQPADSSAALEGAAVSSRPIARASSLPSEARMEKGARPEPAVPVYSRRPAPSREMFHSSLDTDWDTPAFQRRQSGS